MEEDALREQVLHQIWMSQFHKLGKSENEYMKLGHSKRKSKYMLGLKKVLISSQHFLN